jgi:hypothetical protein
MMLIVSDYLPTFQSVELFVSGSTALAIVGHMVNTFPTPQNVYGQWFLGVIKFAVGQRISAMNAFKGQDTVVASVPRGMGTGTGQATAAEASHVEITEKTSKVEVSIPNPNPIPPTDKQP